MRLAFAVAAVLAFWTGPAWATGPGSTSPSPGARQGSSELAALQIRAEVDQLLAGAGAADLFDNISTDTVGAARHRASGLVCVFAPADPMNSIVVYPARSGGPAAGEDVSCRTGVGEGAFVSVYATRYPDPRTAQSLLDAALGEVAGVWQDVRMMDGGYVVEEAPNYPPALTAGFTGVLQGRRLQSYILVQTIGDWSFKARATGLLEDDSVSLIGSRVFALALPGNWETREHFR